MPIPDNKNPYIPNGSTPIKNEILFEIIAKGLLSYSEIRIVADIIYESWRYIDKQNKRRKDWTNPLTITQISKAIEMSYAETCRNINNMTKSHILLKDGNKYQFNEHYEQYDKKSYMTNSHTDMTNSHTDMTNSHTEQPSNPDENKSPEILNKSLNKSLNKVSKDSIKIEATSKPYLLAKWFYEFRGVNIRPIDIDMRNFKMLLVFYPEEVIKKGIMWRLTHDPKGFWIKNITSAGVYRNFGNWFAESMVKAMSFKTWLNQNPDLDYRKFEDKFARADIFMRGFNESKKNPLVYFTEDDYGNYRLAIQQKTREARKEMK